MKNKTITIDKKLYDKLLDVDKQSELIFENMLNGFALHEMIYDEDGNAIDYLYLTVNPAYTTLTGIPNPTGKKVKDVLPGFEQEWIDLFQSVIESKQSLKFQRYDVTTRRWYDMIAFWVRGNEFSVFFTDITQFKEAEQKIEKSLRLNMILLDAIPHPAMLINKHRIVLAANEKAKDMGASVGGNCFEGFSTCKSICKNNGECCFCNRGLDIDHMDSKHMEIDAYEHVWDTWWVPVGNNAFLHYSIDITDIRRGEQNLVEAARELKSSNEELEQFAYVASHDLQEPLRVVSAYCQMIEMFVAENCSEGMAIEKKQELQQYIDFTKDATRRMSFLIKDLLEFSRVGRSDDNYELIDAQNVIENVIKDFDIAIKEHSVIIEYSDMPVVMVKRKRLGQVFHNIISNAIKFRSDRGIVISIDVRERTNDWLFSISDTGIGIDEKQLERVFGIFKRLHSGDEYPGTGIGLSLVKKIIENHGGESWIESEKGQGSTFFFTIPKIGEIMKLKK